MFIVAFAEVEKEEKDYSRTQSNIIGVYATEERAIEKASESAVRVPNIEVFVLSIAKTVRFDSVPAVKIY